MSHATRPLPSIHQQPPDPMASGSSTPAVSDECQPSLEEHSLEYTVASLPMIHSTTTVKFAPLPEIEPRKRKSNYPLGIAARSQMLQQRRGNARLQGIYRHPPLWSDLDESAVLHVPEEAQEGDALQVLGRLIADKSKSLWRRVSSKNSSNEHAASGDLKELTTTHEEEHVGFPLGSPTREELPKAIKPT